VVPVKFYNRETELEILKRDFELSKKVSAFTVITGRRRIGKTELIKKSVEGREFLYFFVDRESEATLCERLARDAESSLGIILIDNGRFSDLFKQVMMYGKEKNFTFIIDEFQELDKINNSIMSGIQNHWDEYRKKSNVNLIVSGSVYSMMVKIFESYREPLFGRATSKFNLGPFKPSVLREILKDYNPDFKPDDLLFLYMVTGGIPKYIEELMDNGATTFDKMLDRVCSPGSLFLTDGKTMLVLEFGKEYGTYHTILQLIAKGKNTLGEINDIVGKDASPYLAKLEREYRFIKRSRPMFSKDNARDTRWHVSDNYLRFYFKFIADERSAIELERNDLLKETILSEYTQYSGLVLEKYFKEKIAEEERVTSMGSYWDRKGQNEIDIIALNDLDKKAIVAEVKRNPAKADVEDLIIRAGSVEGLRGFDIEYRVLSLNDM
jgi:AAA+ ATPase superfamily predicted ATPase